MHNIRIIQYGVEYKEKWDAFVNSARNSHFFFLRDYMEYHADRFVDASLIAINEKNLLVALFPSSRHDKEIITHGGLSFGGWLINEKMSTEDMLEIFNLMKQFYKEQGINKIKYKCIPYIYDKYPCEEDKYALFVNDAKLYRRDVSTAIYMPTRYKYQKGRKWMVSKGRKNHIEVAESRDYAAYMELEKRVLEKYHGTKPVHTAEEMKMLATRFPENIHLYTGALDGELLAGTIVFVNGNVVHTQYMANSDKGRELGALDRVIDYLITDVYADCIYFDFGISNEEEGRYLNRGLIGQKEGFGARAVVHDFYELDI